MHRDMKRVNIAIYGIGPLMAVIMDLDSTKDEVEAYENGLGTRAFASEIVHLDSLELWTQAGA